MKPPDFLKVLPTDIGRVGVLGAAILALVRYVTEPTDEKNGRKMVDGFMWWCASHNDIGEALGGVHRDSIRRALVKLQATGELLAIPAERRYGDRAQAYRVPDLPLRGMQQGSDLPLRENAESITRNTASSCGETQQAAAAKSPNLPITGELEEHSVGENGAAPAGVEPLDAEAVPDPANAHPQLNRPARQTDPAAAWVDAELVDDDPDPEPQPYCDRHMPHGTDARCGACKRRRQAHEAWQQRALSRVFADATSSADAGDNPRAAIAQCPDCDEYGQIDYGNRVANCRHPKLRRDPGGDARSA